SAKSAPSARCSASSPRRSSGLAGDGTSAYRAGTATRYRVVPQVGGEEQAVSEVLRDSVGGADDTTAPAAHLPPGPALPRWVQGLGFSLARRWTVERLARRYGAAFRLNVPLFGPMVVVTDPRLAKQVFTSRPEVL